MESDQVLLVTTVLSAAAGYDLTTLATVKTELGLKTSDTSNDTWLGTAITQVSKAIARTTKRVFPPEFVQDLFDIRRARMQVPTGVRTLQLSRWPVISIASVVQTQDDLTTTTFVENTDFRADYTDGQVYRLNSDTGRPMAWEPQPLAVQYSGGYGVSVAETHSVPANPGPYTVTVTNASTFSCNQSVAYASGTLLTQVTGTPATGQYSVDSSTGVYTFAAGDAGQSLDFVYCTLAVPDDLADATLQLITSRFRAKGRDPALIQRDTPGVGVERFWFGGAPGQTGPFPPDIQYLLDNYRVPVTA